MGDENGGSNINAVSSKVIGRFGIKEIPGPHPYKMS